MNTASPKPNPLKAAVLNVRAGLAALAAAHDGDQRRYIAVLLCREATTLAEQCLRRNNALSAAYDWIEAHQDDPDLTPDDLKAREERWLLSLRQYEVAMDLLGETLEAVKVNASAALVASTGSEAMSVTQEALL